MGRISRTWIRTETNERLTIKHGPNRPARLTCSACVEEVAVATLSESKQLVQMTAREIFRRAEDGIIHILENAGDEPMVCLKSLARSCRVLQDIPGLNEGTTQTGETI